MADIQQLEDQIVSLSLLEASELVKKLEARLGVSAAAAVAAAAPAAGGGAAAAAPPPAIMTGAAAAADTPSFSSSILTN